jgi:hypothetical protein
MDVKVVVAELVHLCRVKLKAQIVNDLLGKSGMCCATKDQRVV